ncbi:MAG: YkvA family protein [Mangrovibacterium sp.]
MDKEIRKILNKIQDYANNFSESDFWRKIKKIAKIAGVKVLYSALLLYYTLIDENTPAASKAKIIGALGYLILPIDLIPDVMIPLGFTDDLAVLLFIIDSVQSHITFEIKQKAQQKLTEIIGDYDDHDIKGVLK